MATTDRGSPPRPQAPLRRGGGGGGDGRGSALCRKAPALRVRPGAGTRAPRGVAALSGDPRGRGQLEGAGRARSRRPAGPGLGSPNKGPSSPRIRALGGDPGDQQTSRGFLHYTSVERSSLCTQTRLPAAGM
ncbi:uncharacterized protein LOC106009708 isoform X2 [Heterocephalus glaber]|uniref:Uncharacterized protein LOC106009708 isoform X2 n=1 Tax=Heterocephalus glaber TaxID=10181 RepID=A0AAX6TA81_HETGA|nr:uncharacterized protein LOC106009708 isoform X2 [Heterocephalus glaber]